MSGPSHSPSCPREQGRAVARPRWWRAQRTADRRPAPSSTSKKLFSVLLSLSSLTLASAGGKGGMKGSFSRDGWSTMREARDFLGTRRENSRLALTCILFFFFLLLSPLYALPAHREHLSMYFFTTFSRFTSQFLCPLQRRTPTETMSHRPACTGKRAWPLLRPPI